MMKENKSLALIEVETERELNHKQEQAIIALLQYVTVPEAAEAVGIGESTLYRWLSQPLFRSEYRKQRRMMYERAVGLAQRSSVGAISAAVNIVNKSNNDVARISAIRIILDFARETDVEQRLLALEEQLEGSKAI
jgi:RES domain-containing protein